MNLTHLILSDFKRHFHALIHPHPHPHDQYARGVVVCCEGAVSYQTCLICFAILALLACLLACFALLCFACLVCFATSVQLATLLACFVLLCFACLLACLALLCFALRVKHPKLNQTMPYGVVWLTFWFSTYVLWIGLS